MVTLRRTTQLAGLILFAWLLFYVTWPYTATPARQSTGWYPAEVDTESGSVTLQREQAAEPFVREGRPLYLVDRQSGGEAKALGRYEVVHEQGARLRIEPTTAPSAAQRIALSTGFGPWSLDEDSPDAWPSHYASDLESKSGPVPPSSVVRVDPLVGTTSSLAAGVIGIALVWALVALALGWVLPRWFCSYACPLGTLLDVFDATAGRALRWVTRGALASRRFYSSRTGLVRFGILAAVLVAALWGVTLAGYVAPIPLLTRAAVAVISPLQTAAERGWYQVSPMTSAHLTTVGLLVAVLAAGLIAPRFWCRYLCPSGAMFSAIGQFGLVRRRVDQKCTGCGTCRDACDFDAIDPRGRTIASRCALCRECEAACAPGAVRYQIASLGDTEAPPTASPEDRGRRRRFLTEMAAGVAGGVGVGALAGWGLHPDERELVAAEPTEEGPLEAIPIRPPGSLPERRFLQECVRCGQCIQACPNGVLQPMPAERGALLVWTPVAMTDWSGCEPSCANCGQVCPTGAIRALPLEEKRHARMGLAVVDTELCLPHAGREACRLCVDECAASGYSAIEFIRVGTDVDSQGRPVAGTGFDAPRVLPEKCVGCGLCQTRCYAVNCREKGLIAKSAIRVVAGPGHEDRLIRGSYARLRQKEAAAQRAERQRNLGDNDAGEDDYLPDFLE